MKAVAIEPGVSIRYAISMRTPRQIDAPLGSTARSSAMKAIERTLRVVAPKDVPVTIVGESGTGKEVLARRLHEISPRRNGPFVPINCAAIPETLFESELFGHERGAFTGAHERSRGKVEAASKGTLFLDEIGETPLPMQAKLLRFIENRRFMRVGGSVKVNADIRLVSATLRPLDEEVKAGRFRADLYYRIQGIILTVPPLRQRRGDILALFNDFVAESSLKHQVEPPQITRAAKAALLAHDWPGNVRELRNTAENLCLLHAGRRVTPDHLPIPLSAPPTSQLPEPGVLISVDVGDGLRAAVNQVIEQALRIAHGNTTLAARRLGVSIRTVQRYLARGGAGKDS